MAFLTIVKSPVFWGYTLAAAFFLCAWWLLLYWLRRRGQPFEEGRRVFWTWVMLAGILTPAVLLGQEVFALAVALVSVFACKEFARATGLYEDWIFTGLVYLGILAANLIALWPGYDVFMATPIYAVAVLCLVPVLRDRTEGMLQRVALSVMAFVYFGYFLAHLSLLYAIVQRRVSLLSAEGVRLDSAYGYLFFVVYGTAVADLVGWLVGRKMGRHPLAPRITPHATWERAGGSLACGLFWSLTLGWTLPQPEFNFLAMVLSGLLFGVMGPLGNLVVRYILHDLGLKGSADGPYSIPYLALGHINRLIFVAPLFFRLVHYLF